MGFQDLSDTRFRSGARVLVNTNVLACVPNDVDHPVQQLDPEVTGPRQLLKRSGITLSSECAFQFRPDDLRRSLLVLAHQHVIASSRLPMVAEMPQILMAARTFNRPQANSICTPRLFPNKSCHSSTTSTSSPPNLPCAPFFGQQHMQTFGCRDQDFRQTPVLFLFFGGGRISRPTPTAPPILRGPTTVQRTREFPWPRREWA